MSHQTGQLVEKDIENMPFHRASSSLPSQLAGVETRVVAEPCLRLPRSRMLSKRRWRAGAGFLLLAGTGGSFLTESRINGCTKTPSLDNNTLRLRFILGA